MSLFSICNNCWTCRRFDGHCYAGNGDDDYFPATKEQILCRLSNKNANEYDRQHMINFLKHEYGIGYGHLTGSELLELTIQN